MLSKQSQYLVYKHFNRFGRSIMLGLVKMENKISSTFYYLVKSQRTVLNAGAAELSNTELSKTELKYKVVKSAVFTVAHTNKRNACKA